MLIAARCEYVPVRSVMPSLASHGLISITCSSLISILLVG